jgi:hypothetical protein
MKINHHSKPENREQWIIPVSKFSFAAYPILIHQGFRRAAHPASAPVPLVKHMCANVSAHNRPETPSANIP